MEPLAAAPEAATEPVYVPTGAWRSRRAWLTVLIVAAFSVGVDLASKWAAFRWIADAPVEFTREDVLRVSRGNPRNVNLLVPAHESVAVVPGALELTLVLNPGAVFGMGPGQRWFFIAFTAVALAFGLWMFGRWTGPRDRWAHAAIGLLLGGGLGNLYDRLVYGCVRDFLHPLPRLMWPFGWRPFGSVEIWPYVSNMADLLLLIGIGILLVYLWRKDGGRALATGSAGAAGA